jgi:hypothetical protein
MKGEGGRKAGGKGEMKKKRGWMKEKDNEPLG